MPNTRARQKLRCFQSVVAVAGLLCVLAAQAVEHPTHKLNIPAQDLGDALKALGAAANEQLLFAEGLVAGRRSEPLSGEYTTDAALSILLRNSGLRADRSPTGVVLIREVGAKSSTTTSADYNQTADVRLAQSQAMQQVAADSARASAQSSAAAAAASAAEDAENARGVPEILVTGSKVRNTDIRRTRDDALPFVSFDRHEIEASGATNVESFFRSRLPMDTNSVQSNSVDPSLASTNGGSQFNFRGLGPEETLILVDGRRLVSYAVFGTPRQPDLNVIPMSAIERIEVLPASASAIYGSGATGGVINIVTRRDYQGLEVSLGYESPFDTQAPIQTLGISGGYGFNDGRTQAVFYAGKTRNDVVYERDRGYIQKFLDLTMARDPARITGSNTPPVGSTPNIRSSDNSPLFGAGTPNYTSVPVGYAGGQGLTPFLNRQGVYNLALPSNNSLFSDQLTPYGSVTERNAVSAGLTQQLGGGWEGFIDYAYSENLAHVPAVSTMSVTATVAAGNTFNPFGRNVRVSFVPPHDGTLGGALNSEFITHRAGIGVNKRLGNRWALHFSGSWDYSRQENVTYVFDSTRFQSIVDAGQFNPFRDLTVSNAPMSLFVPTFYSAERLPNRTILLQGIARAAGPVYTLPAGDVLLTVGGDVRDEELKDSAQRLTYLDGTPRLQGLFPTLGTQSDVWAAYAEVSIPLIGEKNSRPGLRQLDAQVAARHEDFSTFGSVDSPQLGMRYSPVRGVLLRANWGTGFLPPTAGQLAVGLPNAGQTIANDPKRNGQQVVLSASSYLVGGNPDLDAEESESLGFGVIFEPAMVSGLRLSVDYYKIRKTDEIRTINVIDTINLEDQLPGRVQRGPVAPGDPFGVGLITFVDARTVNFARLVSEGFDVTVEQRWRDIFGGDLFASVIGTFADSYQVQLAATQPLLERLGDPIVAIGAPLKRRGSATVRWEGQQWGMGWFTQYVDSYAVLPADVVLLGTRIPSVVTHDLSASWRAAATEAAGFGRWLSGTSLNAGIKNVFDKDAPLFNRSSTPWSPYSDANLRGRSYYLTLRKQF